MIIPPCHALEEIGQIRSQCESCKQSTGCKQDSHLWWLHFLESQGELSAMERVSDRQLLLHLCFAHGKHGSTRGVLLSDCPWILAHSYAHTHIWKCILKLSSNKAILGNPQAMNIITIIFLSNSLICYVHVRTCHSVTDNHACVWLVCLCMAYVCWWLHFP